MSDKLSDRRATLTVTQATGRPMRLMSRLRAQRLQQALPDAALSVLALWSGRVDVTA